METVALLAPLDARADAAMPVAGTVVVDLTKIAPGSGIKISWHDQPVFVRSLTPQEIKAADAVPMSALRDPATLADRTRPGYKNWLITYGVCTHLGCVPLGITAHENRGTYGGYVCPCHGSQYDTAGRVRSGPAPSNLEIPDYRFLSPGVVEIGERA